MTLRALFVTQLYEARLRDEALIADLAEACRALEAEDAAGRAWSRHHAYGGYTSYGSLDDLPRRMSVFDELRRRLDRHVRSFAGLTHMDLRGGRLKLDSLWVNILRRGGAHTGHIHPHSVISGTVYVAMPPGAGGLKIEDPRLPQMMAAPPRAASAPESARTFVSLEPETGSIYLWESWLRHEALANRAKTPRISVSFNYGWR